MKYKSTIWYVLLFVPIILQCQSKSNFKFEFLETNTKVISNKEKTMILYFFEEVSLKEAKTALFQQKYPKKLTDRERFNIALNRKSYHENIKVKRLYYEDGMYKSSVIDSAYYESLPYESVLEVAENHYKKRIGLENQMQHNTSNIDEAVKLAYNTLSYLLFDEGSVGINVGLFNLTNKPISKVFGELLITDNYGEVIISGNYAFTEENHRDKVLNLDEFEAVMNNKGWFSTNIIWTLQSQETINKIKESKEENLILVFKPNKIVFADKTELIRK